MKWQDIDARLPDAPLDARDTHEVWVSDEAIDSVLVHLARTVLGLSTEPFTENEVDSILGAGTMTQIPKGLRALAAMCFGRWSIAKHLVDKPLASTPLPNRDCSADPAALARQLGTAVQTRAPSTSVAKSMDGLRAAFASGRAKYDPRLALVAAHLYLHQLAPADDVPAACREWLETGELPEHAPLTTDDLRVKIFENHQLELADDKVLAHIAKVIVEAEGSELWRRRSNSDLAIKLFVARWPLPDGWERHVEPDACVWLGGSSTPAECKQWRETLAGGLHGYIPTLVKRDRLVEALWLDRPDNVLALSGKGKLAAFKPGKTFGGDVTKLVRYLAAAAGARPADVEPAWHAFLASRRPLTLTEHERVGWRELAMLQSVITERLGGGKPEDVGPALRATITGSLPSTA